MILQAGPAEAVSVQRDTSFSKENLPRGYSRERPHKHARGIRDSKHTEQAFEYGLVPDMLPFEELGECSSGPRGRKQDSIPTLRAMN